MEELIEFAAEALIITGTLTIICACILAVVKIYKEVSRELFGD